MPCHPVKHVRLSRLAEVDLDEIWLYVAADGGVDVANRLIDDIMDPSSCSALSPTPASCVTNSPSAFAVFPSNATSSITVPSRAIF